MIRGNNELKNDKREQAGAIHNINGLPIYEEVCSGPEIFEQITSHEDCRSVTLVKSL